MIKKNNNVSISNRKIVFQEHVITPLPIYFANIA